MKTRNTKGLTLALVEGKEMPVLVADLNAGQKSVIVSESVLEYLIGLLPKASFRDIKNAFIDKVNLTENMSEFTEVIREELEFHANVNMVRTYYGIEEPAQPTAVASSVQ